MAKLPSIEEMAKDVVQRVLQEITINDIPLLEFVEKVNNSVENNDCNLATCRYNKDGKCTNEEKRKECVDVANKVFCIDNKENKKNTFHICETNPDCKENPSNCEYAIDCSTFEDVSNGKRRYIRGLGGECNCCK